MHSNMRNFTAEYVYQPYPRWVTLADGSQIIVKNAEEEKVAIGTEEDRDDLMAKAKEMGLNPHPRCGVDKLREMIAKGQ